MSESWLSEVRWVIALALVMLVVGLLTGHVVLFLLLGVLSYLGWHLFNLVRLLRWFQGDKRFHPPEARGVWGDVYYSIYRLQQRNRLRRRRIVRMLNRFQDATAVMPDATVVMGAQGEIEWWNDAAGDLLGLRVPQDRGRRIVNLVRHPVFAEFFAARDYSLTVQFPAPVNEQLMLAVRIVPYGGDRLLLVARDVTPVFRLDQVRRDFIANVSHELRTPLTVIGGFLETMSEDDDECNRRWGRSLYLMKQQADRMQRLVGDLLLLSRLEMEKGRYHREMVNVAALLASIREEASALSGERRHAIHLDADPVLQLRGSGEELRSAFSNLVFNAVRYTPDGGDIHIRWYADDAGAHFEVRDTGVGIAAEHIPRLTERFYRVDTGRSRESGGTGLGLAIVKHVLNRHEGQLHIESEPGKGSTFVCDFPPALIC